MNHHQPNIFITKRFFPLFLTQFSSALNDNLLKNAMIVLLTFQTTQWSELAPEILANISAAVFILPFFLFSAIAGQLADKFDKAQLTRIVKLIEIAVVIIAGVGLLIHSLIVLMFSLFLLGSHSALFGPIKYAILPQHLKPNELLSANAMIQASTFTAILVGTLLGGLLASTTSATTITLTGLIIAILGYLASCYIPLATPSTSKLDLRLNPITATWHTIKLSLTDQKVFRSILAISWFWFYGALLITQFPAYTKTVLNGDETVVTLLLIVFTLGVGIGSLTYKYIARINIDSTIMTIAIVGLTIFGFNLYIISPEIQSNLMLLGLSSLLSTTTNWYILADLMLIGVFGGLLIVPLYTTLQELSNPAFRARIIAANNIFNALFMVIGAVVTSALLVLGLSISEIFGLIALCNIWLIFITQGLSQKK